MALEVEPNLAWASATRRLSSSRGTLAGAEAPIGKRATFAAIAACTTRDNCASSLLVTVRAIPWGKYNRDFFPGIAANNFAAASMLEGT
jgi:hypothetical protein